MTTAATSQPPLAGGQDLPADSGGLGNVTEDGGVRKACLATGDWRLPASAFQVPRLASFSWG